MSDEAPRLTVLPPNSSLLELGLDLAFGKLLERIVPPFPELMNASDTPEAFLPYLAADRGVGEWSPSSSEAERRDTVGSSWAVKRLAGTRRALDLAVEGLQMQPQVLAWYEQSPPGAPYHFLVTAWADQPYSEATNARLDARLAAAKSERDVLTTRIGMSTRSSAFIGAALVCGETTTIYPLQVVGLDQSTPVHVAAALNTVEKTTIYPLVT